MTEATTETAATTATETAKAPRKKRAVREQAARVFVLTGKSWVPTADKFDTIAEGEAWVDKHGLGGVTYWVLKGPATAVKLSQRSTEAVEV